MKVSRNVPCPCGSGQKHKRCCLGQEPSVDELRAVAFGVEGPDRARLDALFRLQEIGELEAGTTVSVWQSGEWCEQFLHEITPDAVEPIPEGELRDTMGRALDAMHSGDLKTAERLNRWLCEQMPDEPAPHNNLAGALVAQGRIEEGERILRDLLAANPTYLPARTALVQLKLADKQMDQVRQLLTSVRMPARVHPELYARFLVVKVRAEQLSDSPEWDAIDHMLDIVEELVPDDEDLTLLRVTAGMGRLAHNARLRSGNRRHRGLSLPGEPARALERAR